jgi:CDGSH iron-sulfur domain-containing protein 3
MSKVEIRVNRNGPYFVKGDFTLTDHKGNSIRVEGDETFLCRCGQSDDKPFCDGSHRECGFKGDAAAVRDENLVAADD